MAEDERPPSWVPVDQHVGQVPIAITTDIDSASLVPKPAQDIHALAAQIIRDNQPVINRFVAMQRQQVEVGEKDIHNNVLPLQGLTVYYQNVQGMERMHYHVSPKAEESPEAPAPQEEAKAPTPPKPEEPTAETPPPAKAREPEIPEPAKPPEFEEPTLPEEEKPPEVPPLPEEEKPPEVPMPEEEERELTAPDFLSIDIPCFLAVEFADGAD